VSFSSSSLHRCSCATTTQQQEEQTLAVMIDLPPTTGSVSTSFKVNNASANGGKGGPVSSVTLVNGVGTMILDGKKYNVISYYYQTWQTYDLILIDLFGIAADGTNLAIIYLYLNSAGIINTAYSESFTQTMTSQTATGQVSWEPQNSQVVVNFPAIHAPINPVRTSISVSGDYINLGSNLIGWAVFGNTNFTWIPFATVACSTCSMKRAAIASATGGWLELHSMFVPAGDYSCFAIIYLIFGKPNSIQMEYGLCIGSQVKRVDTIFSASWSGHL